MSIDSNKIEAAESDYLYVKESQIPHAGNGLFTAIRIFKDEIISVFKGDILTDAQAEIYANEGLDRYFINLLDGTIMDSMNVDCFAKYANDASGFSTSVFKNNAMIALDENDNVCLIATSNIKEGQEVFCSYGKEYWKKHK